MSNNEKTVKQDDEQEENPDPILNLPAIVKGQISEYVKLYGVAYLVREQEETTTTLRVLSPKEVTVIHPLKDPPDVEAPLDFIFSGPKFTWNQENGWKKLQSKHLDEDEIDGNKSV